MANLLEMFTFAFKELGKIIKNYLKPKNNNQKYLKDVLKI